MKWVIFGHRGWIGSMFCNILKENNEKVICMELRAECFDIIKKYLSAEKPDRVVCMVGRTSGPGFNSIDYLEQKGKLVENTRDNLMAPITLANICKELNLHLTYLGTGCIFSGYSREYTEDDKPDFFGSQYSIIKGVTDQLMKQYSNVLNVRIRMPITKQRHPKDFVTKILAYENICSMTNSMTYLDELLPILYDMALNKRVGTINLVNPDPVDHNYILAKYKEKIDSTKNWNNITVEEQNKILLSQRSNNILSTKKLEEWYPNVKTTKEVIDDIFQ